MPCSQPPFHSARLGERAPTLPPSTALRGLESGPARTDARHQLPPPGTAAAEHERQEHVKHGYRAQRRFRVDAEAAAGSNSSGAVAVDDSPPGTSADRREPRYRIEAWLSRKSCRRLSLSDPPTAT